METNNMKKIINILTKNNETISVMESCTGGGVTNVITNIEGASNVLKFSAVTYSNEYKIKMGVPKNIIEKYSVYSIETAIEMSKAITKFTNSDIGIGITGKLNRPDQNNNYGKDNEVFVSIYIKKYNKNYNFNIITTKNTREENKNTIIEKLENRLLELLN